MPYQSIATTLVFVRLRWLTCTVCCCLKSLRGLAFLRRQGHERPGCKVKGKSGSPNTPPAVSSPSTGTNFICMVNGLTYESHSSKKVVLPLRKMARKVLGGACRYGVLQGGGALEGSRGRQHSGTLRLHPVSLSVGQARSRGAGMACCH